MNTRRNQAVNLFLERSLRCPGRQSTGGVMLRTILFNGYLRFLNLFGHAQLGSFRAARRSRHGPKQRILLEFSSTHSLLCFGITEQLIKLRTVQQDAIHHNRVDVSSIRDVCKRIYFEHDEIGCVPRLDTAPDLR